MKTIAAILFAAVTATAAWFADGRWIAPRRAPLVDTIVVRPSVNDVDPPLLTANGYLVADREAKITPKISGRILKLNADTGKDVRRGDVLAVLESTSLNAQLAGAVAMQEDAQGEFERQSALFKEGIASRSSFDSAEAQMKSAKAKADEIRIDMQDMVIRAPFDGTIATKDSEVGEVVSSTTLGQVAGTLPAGAICTLVDLKTLKVVADVNETNLSQIREGQPAEVSVDAFPGRKWRGVLTEIIPTADRAKGIVPVKVAILDPNVRLLPEMSASVSFLRAQRSDGDLNEPQRIWVPQTAIAGGRVASVDANSRIEWIPVKSGLVRNDRIEVEGLRAGERIVVRDAAALRSGELVRTSG